MPYEVIVPVKHYVREYLLSQYGNMIFLPETNALSVLLRDDSDKKKYRAANFRPDLYSEKVKLLSEVRIPELEDYQVFKFNHYVELTIKLMTFYRAETTTNNLKDVILDVMAENNFPEEKYDTIKSYILSLRRYAREFRTPTERHAVGRRLELA